MITTLAALIILISAPAFACEDQPPGNEMISINYGVKDRDHLVLEDYLKFYQNNDKEDIQRWFGDADRNSDGKITAQEIDENYVEYHDKCLRVLDGLD